METGTLTLDGVVAQMVAEAATALKDAAAEYGPEAVDLTLTVVQLSAVQYLALRFALLAILLLMTFKWPLPLAYATAKKWEAEAEERANNGYTRYDGDGVIAMRVIPTAGVGLVWIITAGTLSELLDPFQWFAAFGSPEALMARNALQTVGLL